MTENKNINNEVKTSDNALIKAYDKIESGVAGAYEAVEKGVVGAYKAVENGVVGGFNKMTDKIVGAVFTRKGETVEEAKARLNPNAKPQNESDSE